MVKKKTEEQKAPVEAAIEETPAEAKPKKTAKKAAAAEETSVIDDVVDTVASAVETVAETVVGGAAFIAEAVVGGPAPKKINKGKRAEKIGVVASDKMTKTVVVRVDRLVKHPIYRKYVRKRKKFMAHDELGSKIGDKVRIVETRPLSARKRWRVVEIIHKAEL